MYKVTLSSSTLLQTQETDILPSTFGGPLCIYSTNIQIVVFFLIMPVQFLFASIYFRFFTCILQQTSYFRFISRKTIKFLFFTNKAIKKLLLLSKNIYIFLLNRILFLKMPPKRKVKFVLLLENKKIKTTHIFGPKR